MIAAKCYSSSLYFVQSRINFENLLHTKSFIPLV